MKTATDFLIKKYAAMSGDQKVRISFGLNKMISRIKKDGERAMKGIYGKRSSRTSY